MLVKSVLHNFNYNSGSIVLSMPQSLSLSASGSFYISLFISFFRSFFHSVAHCVLVPQPLSTLFRFFKDAEKATSSRDDFEMVK